MESVKEKRVLSPEHLEKLKVSREKALAVRQKRAEEKKLEKQLATKEHEIKIDNIKERLEDISKPKKVVKPPDSDTDSEASVVVKKKKKKPKKIVIVEDTDSDDEQQQVIFVKRKKEPSAPIPVVAPVIAPVAPPEPQVSRRRDPNEIYAEHYQRNGFQRRY